MLRSDVRVKVRAISIAKCKTRPNASDAAIENENRAAPSFTVLVQAR